MKPSTTALIQINLAAFILGTAGPAAKLITWPADLMMLGRAVVCAIALFVFMAFQRKHIPSTLTLKSGLLLLAQGLLLGVQWVIYAVQISSVAPVIISLYTYPLITILLEAVFLGESVDYWDALSAVLIVIAFFLIAPELSLNNATTKAIVLTLFSALCISIRNILSQQSLQEMSGVFVMGIQAVVISLMLLPMAFFKTAPMTPGNLIGIFLFGTLLTAVAHTLFVSSLAHLKASTVGLISSVEPLHAIGFAALILLEFPPYPP
ncbi:MAG: drug/metabolite transporter (DMT)-like permease [Candidatus Marinamargulisbacteria bacterium]|jgi:drug/metabolite transporter (DMT)-like permease